MNIVLIIWSVVVYLAVIALMNVAMTLEPGNPFLRLILCVFWPVTFVLFIFYVGIVMTAKDCINYLKEMKEEKRNEKRQNN